MMRLYYTTVEGRLGLFSDAEQRQFNRYVQANDDGFVLSLFLNGRRIKDVLWLTRDGEVHKLIEGFPAAPRRTRSPRLPPTPRGGPGFLNNQHSNQP